mmetsp:Transcript_2585/g.6065  ORF Transcript_2585/g.6065 Transcript_2585/m.6065 type:complete len:143 (-) Transcript_2585:127-555(-)
MNTMALEPSHIDLLGFEALQRDSATLEQLHREAEAADGAESVEEEGQAEEIGPNCTTAMMLHCLFAMVFAAATLGLLNCLGVVVSSKACCPPEAEGYGACAMWQDFRSVMSFLLGAFVCCIISCGNKHADSSGKVQLYTFLL